MNPTDDKKTLEQVFADAYTAAHELAFKETPFYFDSHGNAGGTITPKLNHAGLEAVAIAAIQPLVKDIGLLNLELGLLKQNLARANSREAMVKRGITKLWKAVEDGTYNPRSIVGDQTLNMKEILFGDSRPHDPVQAEIDKATQPLGDALDEAEKALKTCTHVYYDDPDHASASIHRYDFDEEDVNLALAKIKSVKESGGK